MWHPGTVYVPWPNLNYCSKLEITRFLLYSFVCLFVCLLACLLACLLVSSKLETIQSLPWLRLSGLFVCLFAFVFCLFVCFWLFFVCFIFHYFSVCSSYRGVPTTYMCVLWSQSGLSINYLLGHHSLELRVVCYFRNQPSHNLDTGHPKSQPTIYQDVRISYVTSGIFICKGLFHSLSGSLCVLFASKFPSLCTDLSYYSNKTIAILTTQRNFYTNVQYDDFLLVNMIMIIHLTFKSDEESMFSKLIDA